MGCGAISGDTKTDDGAEEEATKDSREPERPHRRAPDVDDTERPHRRAPFHRDAADGDGEGDEGRDGSKLPAPPPPPERWEWQQGPEAWREFEPEISRKFIVARRLGMKKLVYCHGGKAYAADLEKLEQVNKMTGYTRKLRLVKDSSGPATGARSSAERARASAAFDAYARTGGRGRRDASAHFQWQLKNGDWVDYEDDEAELIAKAWASGKHSVKYQARGHDYEIDFDHMAQVNLGTSQLRTIRVVDRGQKKSRPAETNFPAPPEPPPFAGAPKADLPRRPPAYERESERDHDARRFRAPGFRAAAEAGRARAEEDPGPRRRATSPPPPPPPKAPGTKRPTRAAHEDPGPRRTADPWGIPGRGGADRRPPRTAAAARPASHALPDGICLPEDERAKKEAEALYEELYSMWKEPISERKKAYKAACMRWHPDKNPDDEDVATEVFQFLQALKTWFFC